MLPEDRVWTLNDSVDVCELWSQEGHADTMRIERWQQPKDLGERVFARGFECLVLDGHLEVQGTHFGARSFFRVPEGGSLPVSGGTACTLLVREGGFNLMR